MSITFDPVWRARLAAADAAAAIREDVEHYHSVESGLAAERDVVFRSRARRIRARRRIAYQAWLESGFGLLRGA